MTDWHRRFLEMAKLVSTWSKDPSTKTGAVIVRPDKSVCSVGFNGFPSRMPDIPELYQNREEKYDRIVHCEINALLFAKERVAGYTLYTYPFASCNRCMAQMIQAGIVCLVCPKLPPELAERWKESLDKTKKYCEEAEVILIEL